MRAAEGNDEEENLNLARVKLLAQPLDPVAILLVVGMVGVLRVAPNVPRRRRRLEGVLREIPALRGAGAASTAGFFCSKNGQIGGLTYPWCWTGSERELAMMEMLLPSISAVLW